MGRIMGDHTRKAILAVTLTLVLTGVASMLLFNSYPVGPDAAVRDLSFSGSSETVFIDFHVLAAPVSGGTAILLPGVITKLYTPSCIFVLAAGTVSISRRDEKNPPKLRDRIVDEIASNPGIHLRELRRYLGCAMGALQYHLKHLERDGYITSLKNGNSRHFFLPNFSDDEQVLRLTAISRNPTVASILFECMRNGRVTQAELSRTLSLDKSLVSYYISNLLSIGVLNAIRVFGREKPMILTSWAHSALMNFALV
jgi:DNA-binding MarR family transcriptional regulator